MKKLIKIIRKAVAGTCVALAMGAAVSSAHAQMPLQMVITPLNNSSNFTPFSANGGTNIASGATLSVSSQPFYIWRGRGFNLTEAMTPASSSTAPLTNVLQFATVTGGPIGSPNAVTNWTSPNFNVLLYCQGAARTIASTNITAAQVDNYALARLLSIGNGTAVTVLVDPTNTYAGLFP
jgi:hypothetical protein